MLSGLRKAAPVECPYLPDRLFIQDYFFASHLDPHEISVILAAGWRRFGSFFFRPSCSNCRECVPLRVDVEGLVPSRSQRRVISRGRNIQMEAVSPRLNDDVWRVYESHSRLRFNREVSRDDFEQAFYGSCPFGLQTEYRLEGELIALGFLDVGEDALNSIYFAFDPRWSRYSPGVLSVFREAQLAGSEGLRWYYIGYWVRDSHSMSYKNNYYPHQIYDWESGSWLNVSR